MEAEALTQPRASPTVRRQPWPCTVTLTGHRPQSGLREGVSTLRPAHVFSLTWAPVEAWRRRPIPLPLQPDPYLLHEASLSPAPWSASALLELHP